MTRRAFDDTERLVLRALRRLCSGQLSTITEVQSNPLPVTVTLRKRGWAKIYTRFTDDNGWLLQTIVITPEGRAALALLEQESP